MRTYEELRKLVWGEGSVAFPTNEIIMADNAHVEESQYMLVMEDNMLKNEEV